MVEYSVLEKNQFIPNYFLFVLLSLGSSGFLLLFKLSSQDEFILTGCVYFPYLVPPSLKNADTQTERQNFFSKFLYLNVYVEFHF